MTRRTAHEQVYVVVRVDYELGADGSDVHAEDSIEIGPHRITVKEVVRTPDEARREVSRLNDLNRDKACRYFWQGSRYFPDGGSFGSDS